MHRLPLLLKKTPAKQWKKQRKKENPEHQLKEKGRYCEKVTDIVYEDWLGNLPGLQCAKGLWGAEKGRSFHNHWKSRLQMQDALGEMRG